MRYSKIKNSLFYFLCFVMMAPLLQNIFSIFVPEPLKGSYQLADSAHFSTDDWFEGKFQTGQERFIEDHIGFRNDLVRLHNQIDYSLFSIAHSDGVVAGKDGYLFDEGYIFSYLGKDFVGEDFINDQLHKAKYLQDTLKKLNISLIISFAPGKASFCSEFIPDRYHTNERTISNYEYYSKKSEELGLNVLDLNKYFMSMKDTSRFPLYPKCSIHWSTYGFTLAADSMVHYIEHLRNIDMPDIIHKGLEFPKELRNSDYDIGDGMNLIWKIPFKNMPYPIIEFENNPAKPKPAVLAIADSYYRNFYYSQIPYQLFTQLGFWYYNKEILPEGARAEKNVSDLDLKTEIEKQQVIILMAAEVNMWRYSYGFINNAFNLYGPKTNAEKQKYYEMIINTDKQLLNPLKQKASASSTDLDELIRNEADKMIAMEKEKELELKENRILFYKKRIQASSVLFQQVVDKSKKLNIPLEDAIMADAKWLYSEENPNPDQRLKEIEEGIRNNKKLMEGENGKAKEHNLTLDEMIKADAKWIYDEERKNKK